MIVLEIVLGLIAFVLLLGTITYSSAFVADITGKFRLLFIQKPHAQAFRLLRWLIAGAATLGLFAAIE